MYTLSWVTMSLIAYSCIPFVRVTCEQFNKIKLLNWLLGRSFK